MSKKSGFTLVELLIAITIIATLSIIGLTTYSSVQKGARDARRKDDLRAIKVALDIYYQANRQYPVTDWVSSNAAQPWIPGLTSTYISSVPTDSVSNSGNPRMDDQYGYAYWSQACGTTLAGQLFVVVAQLENKTDNQRQEIQNYKTICSGNSLVVDPTLSKYSFVITSEQ